MFWFDFSKLLGRLLIWIALSLPQHEHILIHVSLVRLMTRNDNQKRSYSQAIYRGRWEFVWIDLNQKCCYLRDKHPGKCWFSRIRILTDFDVICNKLPVWMDISMVDWYFLPLTSISNLGCLNFYTNSVKLLYPNPRTSIDSMNIL